MRYEMGLSVVEGTKEHSLLTLLLTIRLTVSVSHPPPSLIAYLALNSL